MTQWLNDHIYDHRWSYMIIHDHQWSSMIPYVYVWSSLCRWRRRPDDVESWHTRALEILLPFPRSGRWFGTFFPHSVGNVIIPFNELIFFRGVGTTNQIDCPYNHGLSIDTPYMNHRFSIGNHRLSIDPLTQPDIFQFCGFPTGPPVWRWARRLHPFASCVPHCRLRRGTDGRVSFAGVTTKEHDPCCEVCILVLGTSITI